MGYLSGSFKDKIYFSTEVSLPGKGIFQAGKVSIMSILVRAYVKVSEGLTIDYNFIGGPRVVADFVAVWWSVGFLFSWMWIVVSKQLMLV